jgi:uncharacterized membrane protein YoaK (UPF0700 family)
VRRLATEAAPAEAAAAVPTKHVRKGAGFFSRLSSFMVGAGVTALATQFYIFKELHQSNKIILDKQKDVRIFE